MAADSRSGAFAAVDLMMAELATRHGDVGRRANLWLQRASHVESTAKTLLLLDSVVERVTRADAEARIVDGTCIDEPAADGDNQLLVEVNELLFAELL
jgi:hypothetical protein